MINQIPRHFGQVRGEEIIIAGYHRSMNSCLIVRLSNLPQDEAANLRQIAMSSTAQNLDYLVPTLRVEAHKSGQDWFTYLVTRLQRGDGSVMNMPLKEIEAMNESQKSFFKGYGEGVEPKGGPSQRVGKDTEFRTPLVDIRGQLVTAEEEEQRPRAPANLAEAQQINTAPTPATDSEMARMVAQQGGGSSSQDQVNLAILETLKSLQAGMQELSAEVKKRPRKTIRRKTPVRRKAAASSEETTSEPLAAYGAESA